MNRVYNFVLKGWFYYCKELNVRICKEGLAKWFDLSDKPEAIDIKVSSRKTKNSYLVKPIWGEDCLTLKKYVFNVDIKDSDGSWNEAWTTFSLDRALKNFPKQFYVEVL